MTPNEFRSVVLSMPEAVESAHMNHPDFGVAGRIFATLGYPRRGWGMVKLTPEQQEFFVRAQPGAFVPVKGAWARVGATNVRLPVAKKGAVREALRIAWPTEHPNGSSRFTSLMSDAHTRPTAAPARPPSSARNTLSVSI